MNAERLLAHYDRIADVPDAVPHLRRFILDLAVRGKLVEQDPNDEPASELLKRIARERARLEAAKKIRKAAELAKFEGEEISFDLQAEWLWARFGLIADFSAGRTPARNEPSYWEPGVHPWVSIADIRDGGTLNVTKESVSKTAAEHVFKARPCEVGTIIMSFKLTIGKIARLGTPAFHNEAIVSIRPHLPDLDPWLFLTLPSLARQVTAKNAIKGATLNRTSISNIPIPLPPLAEQHRIVAKVDELMALCDRLEAAPAEREATRDRLAAASFARLDAPDQDPATFREHAAFVLDNLAPLTTRRDQIKALRQTILNLAIRGKLVEQDPDDEPASELLKRIARERARLEAAKKIRKAAELAKFEGEEISFDLQAEWLWARFGLIADFSAGRTPARNEPSYWEPGVHPWVSIADIRDGGTLNVTKESVSKTAAEHVFKARPCEVGTIIMSFKLTIGKIARLGTPAFHNEAIVSIRPHLPDLDPWLFLTLPSLARQVTAKNAIKGATLNRTSISNIPIPLPPLAEQHRILAKVDELMTLCDRLEASLTTGDDTRCCLLGALLSEALESTADGAATA